MTRIRYSITTLRLLLSAHLHHWLAKRALAKATNLDSHIEPLTQAVADLETINRRLGRSWTVVDMQEHMQLTLLNIQQHIENIELTLLRIEQATGRETRA